MVYGLVFGGKLGVAPGSHLLRVGVAVAGNSGARFVGVDSVTVLYYLTGHRLLLGALVG